MQYTSPNKQKELENIAREKHAKAMFSLTLKPRMKLSTKARAFNNLTLADLPVEIVKDIFFKYERLLKAELRDWIKEHSHRIDLKWLCANTNINAMAIIKRANPDDLDWYELSKNPFAIEILSLPKNYHKLEWDALSCNKEAIKLLEAELLKNPSNINWGNLSGNEKASKMIRQRIYYENQLFIDDEDAYAALLYNEKIDWAKLSANPSTRAINLLLEYPDKIEWDYLSSNTNPIAIGLLQAELERDPKSTKIDWEKLSGNFGAIELLKDELKRNPDSTNIYWKTLSGNVSSKAIRLIAKKIEKDGFPVGDIYGKNEISLYNLSGNPKAIKLLQKYQDKIEWGPFSANPAIFNLDLWNTKKSSSLSRSSSSAKSPTQFHDEDYKAKGAAVKKASAVKTSLIYTKRSKKMMTKLSKVK